MTDPLLFAFGVGMIAILAASYIARWILKRDPGTARMQEVSKYIEVGTSAYLKRQFRAIIPVIPWLAIIIFFLFSWTTSLAFVCGVLLSPSRLYWHEGRSESQRKNCKRRYPFTWRDFQNRLLRRLSYGPSGSRNKSSFTIPVTNSH